MGRGFGHIVVEWKQLKCQKPPSHLERQQMRWQKIGGKSFEIRCHFHTEGEVLAPVFCGQGIGNDENGIHEWSG